MDDLYEEEMQCWIANQSAMFLLFWFFIGFFATLFLFLPRDIYFFFKFRKWR